MVARILGRLAELLDREVGGGEIGVAEAEVDDVVARAAQLQRQVPDHGEDVRRQAVDPAELHRASLDAAVGLPGCRRPFDPRCVRGEGIDELADRGGRVVGRIPGGVEGDGQRPITAVDVEPAQIVGRIVGQDRDPDAGCGHRLSDPRHAHLRSHPVGAVGAAHLVLEDAAASRG